VEAGLKVGELALGIVETYLLKPIRRNQNIDAHRALVDLMPASGGLLLQIHYGREAMIAP
jgi:hypothetical protein